MISSGPYKFTEQRARQELHAGTATRTGTRRPTPTAQGAAGQDRRSSSTSTPTTSTTGCMSGDLDVDIAGTGVQAAAQGKILADPTLKAHDGQPRSRAAPGSPSLNSDVAPLDNIDCRKAVEYAATTRPATSAPTAAPPAATSRPACCRRSIPGHKKFDLYRPRPQPQGDVAKAKDELDHVRPARTASRPTSPTAAERPEGEGDRRVAAAVAGQGRHQARRSSRYPTGRLLPSSTPASPTSPRPTTSA